MTDTLKAQCESAGGDYITAERSDSKVMFEAYQHGDYKVNAFVSPGRIRTFARGLIALADEIDGGSSGDPRVSVGERVTITSGNRRGTAGVLASIDTDDVPYLVRLDNGDSYWVEAVRKLPDPSASGERVALLARAREADPSATGAGLVAIARYLSE